MDWDAELTASSSLQRRRELRLGVPGNVPEADMQLFGCRADGQAEVLAQAAATCHDQTMRWAQEDSTTKGRNDNDLVDTE